MGIKSHCNELQYLGGRHYYNALQYTRSRIIMPSNILIGLLDYTLYWLALLYPILTCFIIPYIGLLYYTLYWANIVLYISEYYSARVPCILVWYSRYIFIDIGLLYYIHILGLYIVLYISHYYSGRVYGVIWCIYSAYIFIYIDVLYYTLYWAYIVLYISD